MSKHLRHIFFAWVASFIVAALVVPDLFIYHHISFVAAHDSESPFHNIFTLINQWANGGFSIFDRYDQMNLAHVHTASGIYTLANILSAALYLLCAPFLNSQSEGYQVIYILSFHGLTMLLRTVGGYLLLSWFKFKTWVIVAALVVLNTLLSLAIYQGLLTNNLYSYFPLLVFFILSFADTGKVQYLLASFITMSIAMANSMLMALGYFYEPVHFFILSCAVWVLVTKKYCQWHLWYQIKQQRLAVAGTGLLCALIILPSTWMVKLMSSDFFVAGSGVGGTQGRLQNIINRFNYFTQHDPNVYKTSQFFSDSLNFLSNRWEGAYVFIGLGVLLLTLIALIFSRHQAKWVFFSTIVLVIFANMPLNPWSPLSFAHWLNVLTNPFSFLLHSFGMPAYLMLFAFLPLVAMGLEVLHNIPLKQWRAVALGAIGLILVADEVGAYIYVKQFHHEGKLIKPRVRYPLAGVMPITVEYQNPLTMPFGEHTHALPIPVGMPVLNSNQNTVGLFYKYTPLERYALVEPSLYNPLPMAYKDMYADTDGQGNNFVAYYINQDTRWIFTAPAALSIQEIPRLTWFNMHLERKVVLLDNVDEQTPYTKNIAQVLSIPQVSLPYQDKSIQLSFVQAKKQEQGALVIYQWPLPKNFPTYMASTVFTNDAKLLSVTISGRALTAVQGKIDLPFTFDINNIHAGQIRIGLPKEINAEQAIVDVTWKQSGEILGFWKNTHDHIGLTYQAPYDGWLVMHVPYDAKWRLSIDGRKVNIWKANKYFIATPITQGVHQVSLQYWPGNALKPLFILGIILSFISLIMLVRYGLR